MRQRLFGLACRYLDGNEATQLADDPMHKLVLGHDLLSGPALGPQLALSRLENAVGCRELVCIGHRLVERVRAG